VKISATAACVAMVLVCAGIQAQTAAPKLTVPQGAAERVRPILDAINDAVKKQPDGRIEGISIVEIWRTS
jgi:hypothetical protein